jgi:branched-chain amino acid transport system ATP-binding protein
MSTTSDLSPTSAARPTDGDIVLSTRGVGMRFQGLHALSDVSIDLPRHSITGLIGPNGAGKTTLVNVLSGLAAPTDGEVRYEGAKVTRWRLGRAARAGVARTFQASTVFPEFDVTENVEIGILHTRKKIAVGDVLEMLELSHRAHVKAGDLSFGELRRLGVAIALATGPEVVLMDEPGAGLTGTDLEMLRAVILRIRDAGTTVLLVDHNMRFLMNTVERVVVLEGGRVISEGTPESVQKDERVLAAYLGRGHDA